MTPRRIILGLYALVLAGLGIGAGMLFLDARAEYKTLQQIEAANTKKLAEAKAELARKQKILERLRTDPAYVETEIRKQLYYGKPGEIIFQFKD
jgi:cell division protein FtsB